jgi:hypothetical protein
MLKLTYTENDFSLEYLNKSLEDWIETRVILALRSTTNIHIESSTAAFLLSADLFNLANFEKVVKENATENIVEICRCDAEYVEVILKGTWLTSNLKSHTGIFVTTLSLSVELLLQQLQNEQFSQQSVLSTEKKVKN